VSTTYDERISVAPFYSQYPFFLSSIRFINIACYGRSKDDRQETGLVQVGDYNIFLDFDTDV
jgi:hypothetical protein